MSYTATRDSKRKPTHPGALLRDTVLPAVGISKIEIARMLGITRHHLHDILHEKRAVSPAMAVRLGKLFGNGPYLWARMQATYDTWHAAREVDVSKIPTLKSSS